MRTRLLALLSPLVAMMAPSTPAHAPHDVVDAVALSPEFATDHTLFVASDGSINVFLVSRDGGVTWREARDGLRGVRVKRVRFMSDYATSGEVLVLTDAGFQVSVDCGATWDRTVLEHRWFVDCAFPPVRPASRALAFFCGAVTSSGDPKIAAGPKCSSTHRSVAHTSCRSPCLPEITGDDTDKLARAIRQRVLRYLRKHGKLPDGPTRVHG